MSYFEDLRKAAKSGEQMGTNAGEDSASLKLKKRLLEEHRQTILAWNNSHFPSALEGLMGLVRDDVLRVDHKESFKIEILNGKINPLSEYNEPVRDFFKYFNRTFLLLNGHNSPTPGSAAVGARISWDDLKEFYLFMVAPGEVHLAYGTVLKQNSLNSAPRGYGFYRELRIGGEISDPDYVEKMIAFGFHNPNVPYFSPSRASTGDTNQQRDGI